MNYVNGAMIRKLATILLSNFLTYRLVWRPLVNVYQRLSKFGLRLN
jgi:hypothetical protein